MEGCGVVDECWPSTNRTRILECSRGDFLEWWFLVYDGKKIQNHKDEKKRKRKIRYARNFKDSLCLKILELAHL